MAPYAIVGCFPELSPAVFGILPLRLESISGQMYCLHASRSGRFPGNQGADTLSMREAIEDVMKKMANAGAAPEATSSDRRPAAPRVVTVRRARNRAPWGSPSVGTLQKLVTPCR